MSSAVELHSQIASIMEVLANSAVAEICKAVEDGYAVVNLEVSRSLKENECLRRRVRLLELQVSRYRAEQRLRTPLEGATSGRVFPGVRLLRHGTGRDTPTGFSLQGRNRAVNRSFVSQPQQKTPPMDLDQDPDQDVVTTTKTEPTESEEDSDLVIVKVEGSVSVESPGVSGNSSLTPSATTSDSQAQTVVQTEVSGSQTRNNKTQDETLALSHHQQTKTDDKNEFDSDVIVIDGFAEDITSEKAASSNQKSYVENVWLSFQAPQCSSGVSETAGASSYLTNSIAPSNQQTVNLQPNKTICSQRFESLNSNLSAAHFSGATNNSSNTSQIPPQGGFSGQTFTQDSMRLFSCSKCPKTFSLEAELVKHTTSHRNRKYICELCGKGFVCRSQLEIHQNVHTGERPFKCTLCNSSFSHPSNLRRHMKLQHQLPVN